MSEPATQPSTDNKSDATSSLLSSGELSVERLPVLQTLFAEVCSVFLDEINQLSNAEIEMALKKVWASTADEAGCSDDEHLVVQIQLEDEKPSAYFCMDRSAVYLLLECMLGASGKEKPYAEVREFTIIEQLFAKTVADRAGKAFCQIFGQFNPLKTTVLTAVPGSQILTICDPEIPFLANTLELDVFERTGSIKLLIPQATLAPMRNRFASAIKQASPDSSDQPWIDHIQEQLQQTDMTFQATIDGGQVSLGKISALKIGQVLELDIPADSPVRLGSEEQDLFWCELGQSDGVFTLRVTTPFEEKKDLLDEILEQRNHY